jgi:hypothetical protein
MDLRTGHASFPNEFVDFRRTKKKKGLKELTCATFLSPPASQENITSSKTHPIYLPTLYTQQWYMSYRFVDSFRAAAGSGWNIPILLES